MQKPPRLEWSEEARADLMAIIDYLTDANPQAALDLLDEIEVKVSALRSQLTLAFLFLACSPEGSQVRCTQLGHQLHANRPTLPARQHRRTRPCSPSRHREQRPPGRLLHRRRLSREGVYREKASGARADRPELLRMIADLQPGVVRPNPRKFQSPQFSQRPNIF